jgi:hypothetical protein
MRTSWDIASNSLFTEVGINVQDRRVPAKSLVRKVGVVTLAVSSILACTETTVITHDAGCSSDSIVSVRRVARAGAAAPSRVTRRTRDELSPDGVAGMSTAKLAHTFFALFEPASEPELDADYTFS